MVWEPRTPVSRDKAPIVCFQRRQRSFRTQSRCSWDSLCRRAARCCSLEGGHLDLPSSGNALQGPFLCVARLPLAGSRRLALGPGAVRAWPRLGQGPLQPARHPQRAATVCGSFCPHPLPGIRLSPPAPAPSPPFTRAVHSTHLVRLPMSWSLPPWRRGVTDSLTSCFSQGLTRTAESMLVVSNGGCTAGKCFCRCGRR